PALAARPRGRARLDRTLGLARLALGLYPALLVRDLVALLDHGQVHEAGHRVGEQVEVLLPVAWGVRPGLHLVDREGEGRAIALRGGRPELADDDGPADARRAGHGVT